MSAYDVVIRNGTIVGATGTASADVAISGETVVEIGENIRSGTLEIDAAGKLVLPGGVDTHAHIEQLSASGVLTSDDFRTATVAAAFGGTTTVLSFAAQHRGMDLRNVVCSYHSAAGRKG